MTLAQIAQAILLRAAVTVPDWRWDAIGGLLVVLALLGLAVGWALTKGEPR